MGTSVSPWAEADLREMLSFIAQARSRAVQLHPIKPTLEPTGTKRLKLTCDELLSNVGFKINLRRYTAGGTCPPPHGGDLNPSASHLTLRSFCCLNHSICPTKSAYVELSS